MDVILYNNKSADNVVNKSITKIGDDITGVRFKEDKSLNILRPIILIEYTDDIGDIEHINYFRIPKLNRYYYVTNISAIGGLIEIEGKIDVLMTHKNTILGAKQYVIRQESTKYRKPYLLDNLLPIRSDTTYYTKNFGEPVDNKACGFVIMETTGKGGRVIPST